MVNSVLVEITNKRIKEIDMSEKSIIILKGIPLSVVSPNIETSPIEDIIKNKLAYFFAKIKEQRKFFSFEEFLLLQSFILEQYEKIIILNNNLYINQYPLNAPFSNSVKKGLITHFSESENDYDETPIGNIEEIIAIFNGIKEHNGCLVCAYCEDKIDNDAKIRRVNLFENETVPIQSASYTEGMNHLEIVEEADFIELVNEVFQGKKEICIRTTNYVGDKEKLSAHISILQKNWANCVNIYNLQMQDISVNYESRQDYKDILKKYWGYTNFRSFSVYDLKGLEEGKRDTIQVSQEQIISNIVEQVEKCANTEKNWRDIFVTAPTGAGKSVLFQVPAIYLAEKYNLFTIVVSPLIGLMNDQVGNLEKQNYNGAKTINSEISPIIKEDILQNVAAGNLHILYISPETLLARSSIEQLIGNRTIGMIVVDEAHIVTTWGKQFRPDYWYLGEHIRKLRNNQMKEKGQPFIIATFTATAIYHGEEDMYEETKESLHMIDPITYLGYVKRNDITIRIDTSKKASNEKREYELDKFNDVINMITRAMITGKKTLIYFPTVKLIEECWEYVENQKMADSLTKYYGPLSKDKKAENYHAFYNGEKLVMLATKAFGMGIDIDNIEIVAHFAPTGNVCDYVQEIGRAARRKDLTGEAYYHYDKHDFKHINRLHGLSTIKKYQLIAVVKKIDELFTMNINKNSSVSMTKKRNAMLVDAQNFTYIFNSTINETNDNDNINRVKTALLIIQKDFEAKIGFSPITVRPIPLFSIGFFAVDTITQERLIKTYGDCLEEINHQNNICRINLEKIWNKNYRDKSFPQFKYLLYKKDNDLKFNQLYKITSALCVTVKFSDDYNAKFFNIWSVLKKLINDGVISQEYISTEDVITVLKEKCGIKKYKAQTICEVIFASMKIFSKSYSHGINAIYNWRPLRTGEIKYQFKTAIDTYFKWVEKGLNKIQSEATNGKLYIVNTSEQSTKEFNTILGILEALDVLQFEMVGGANSQLYIYINQVRNLKNIINNPGSYKNKLLEMVSKRHEISVKMLTYIYEGGFTNEQIWNIIENYFLGKLPDKIAKEISKSQT